jgi:hypothetical protein
MFEILGVLFWFTVSSVIIIWFAIGGICCFCCACMKHGFWDTLTGNNEAARHQERVAFIRERERERLEQFAGGGGLQHHE